MVVQSVVFQIADATEQDVKEAVIWLLKHKYKAKKVDITPTQIRFRQKIPVKGAEYITKSGKFILRPSNKIVTIHTIIAI